MDKSPWLAGFFEAEGWVSTGRLEYIAGLFEGDGTVNMTSENRDNKRTRYILQVGVQNSDKELLKPFQTIFGGRIGEVKRTPRGRDQRQMYYWQIGPKASITFLEGILPYIVSSRNRRRVELALEFQRQKQYGGQVRHMNDADKKDYELRQKEYYERMKAINAEGRR